MRCITNTNIIVDDFDFCKEFPKDTFLHFITHFHQDHYEGLSPLWDYSTIYCSEVTKNLILQKFPKVPRVCALELNKKYSFNLNNRENFKIDVWLFDAFHIPGSVMYLFQGYMGTILHTGDFRFSPKMITENPVLFPDSLRTKELTNCSLHVDEMIFDNTYCNPAFDFPRSEEVFRKMVEIIEKNKNKRVLIAMGALGKEDICVLLSQYFQTLLIIPESKLEQLKSIGKYRTDIFTTNREEGFIEIIKKRHREAKIQEFKDLKYDFIVITTDFLMLDHRDPDGINYMVPYSLHSNYKEMESLVKAVGPSILRRLVVEVYKLPHFRRNQVIDNIKFFKGYVEGLRRKGEGGYSMFKQKYTRIHQLSKDFRLWMEKQMQERLLANLGLNISPDKNLRKRKKKEISEEEQAQLDYIYENNLLRLDKKDSISEIAGKLKSTHNNKRIDSCFQDSKQLTKVSKHVSLSKTENSLNIHENPHLKNLFEQFINSQRNLEANTKALLSQQENNKNLANSQDSQSAN